LFRVCGVERRALTRQDVALWIFQDQRDANLASQ
jgi:hypothetical protein